MFFLVETRDASLLLRKKVNRFVMAKPTLMTPIYYYARKGIKGSIAMSKATHRRLIKLLNAAADWLVDELKKLNDWIQYPPAPQGTFIITVRELYSHNSKGSQIMSKRLGVTVDCPPLTTEEEGEVLKRRFRVTNKTTNEELKNEVVTLADPQGLTRQFECNQDDVVKLELFNIDDAGNQSADALTLDDLTIKDTIPPNAPLGAFNFTVRELPDTATNANDEAPTPQPLPPVTDTTTDPVVGDVVESPPLPDPTSTVQSKK